MHACMYVGGGGGVVSVCVCGGGGWGAGGCINDQWGEHGTGVFTEPLSSLLFRSHVSGGVLQRLHDPGRLPGLVPWDGRQQLPLVPQWLLPVRGGKLPRLRRSESTLHKVLTKLTHALTDPYIISCFMNPFSGILRCPNVFRGTRQRRIEEATSVIKKAQQQIFPWFPDVVSTTVLHSRPKQDGRWKPG